MEWQTGNDFDSGSAFISEPGCYHMLVSSVKFPAQTNSGKEIPNGLFTVVLAAAASTVPSQVGKQLTLTFFAPSINHSDQGKFATKKVDRFLLATGLISEDDKNVKKAIDPNKAQGHQIMVKLEKSKGKDDKERVDIAYADIYHVDDPEVAEWPKNAEQLAKIHKSRRKTDAKPSEPASTDTGGLDL